MAGVLHYKPHPAIEPISGRPAVQTPEAVSLPSNLQGLRAWYYPYCHFAYLHCAEGPSCKAGKGKLSGCFMSRTIAFYGFALLPRRSACTKSNCGILLDLHPIA